MVRDHEHEYPTRWAAVESIAGMTGCAPPTLYRWMRQAQLGGVVTTQPAQRGQGEPANGCLGEQLLLQLKQTKGSSFWIAVACKNDADSARTGGYCQLYSNATSIKRLSPGDWIIYYSPRTQEIGGEALQSFTAIGRIKTSDLHKNNPDDVSSAERVLVEFFSSRDVPVRLILGRLSFMTSRKNWGYTFRFGLLKVSKLDFVTVAEAMNVTPGSKSVSE